MGLDINGARLLVKAKSLGVDFSESVTLGRQGLHLSIEDLQKILDENGLQEHSAAALLSGRRGYAEPLLAALGAQVTDSIDASTYEQASIIHDMNAPIPPDLCGRYSLVIDGGTLEHVFNFPVAIRNALQLVKEGGFYIGISPANNFFGHGFYQFSPELYFRVFSAENGFEMVRMLFYSDVRNARVYEVSDPKVVKSRVLLRNSAPSYLFVVARRNEVKPLFERPPLQSDYELLAWQSGSPNPASHGGAIKEVIRALGSRGGRQVASRCLAYLLAVARPIGTGKRQFFRPTDL